MAFGAVALVLVPLWMKSATMEVRSQETRVWLPSPPRGQRRLRLVSDRDVHPTRWLA